MINKQDSAVCTACGENVVTDHKRGRVICTNCGLIKEDRFIDLTSEYRYFIENTSIRGDPRRVGNAVNTHLDSQIDLIEIAKKTSDLDIEIRIVFNDCNKNYLNILRKKIDIAGVKNISIINESETDIFREITESWLLINTSITEVSPLSLIEGNSLSKMFLSYDVGSLDKFKGSIINKNKNQIIFNMRSLYNNSFFINKFESIGLEDYKKNYSIDALKESFNKIRYLF